MNYDMKRSGEHIRQLRIQHGYTQEQFARELNIDRSNLSRIESGRRGCSLELFVQLSDLFDVSSDYLVLGQDKSHLDAPGNSEQLKKELNQVIKQLETLKAQL